jgi:hypothetical protein
MPRHYVNSPDAEPNPLAMHYALEVRRFITDEAEWRAANTKHEHQGYVPILFDTPEEALKPNSCVSSASARANGHRRIPSRCPIQKPRHSFPRLVKVQPSSMREWGDSMTR